MHSMEKWVTRSDAWTPVDDEKLAEIVLRHIRTGSTQLKAFEEAGNELGRTPAACGYRWNGVLRKDYRQGIEDAKQARKDAHKGAPASAVETTSSPTPAVAATSSDSMKDVLAFLQTYDEQYQALRSQLSQVEAERAKLENRVRELEAHHSHLQADGSFLTPQQLEQDSRTLFAIMERARKLLEPDNTRAHAE